MSTTHTPSHLVSEATNAGGQRADVRLGLVEPKKEGKVDEKKIIALDDEDILILRTYVRPPPSPNEIMRTWGLMRDAGE